MRGPVRKLGLPVNARVPIRIVFVEDNELLARTITQHLALHAIDVHVTPTGTRAFDDVARLRPDLVLLELRLDGIELCRRLRQRTTVPIILTGAAASTTDRVRGLDGGADDFVPGPCEPSELVARIRAQVRRARGELGPRRERVELGELVVDPAQHLATLRGTALALTSTELALLHALASHAGSVLDREKLVELLHGSADSAFDRSIDVLVSRLRGKLGDDPKHPQLLKTVRRVGYVLTACPGNPPLAVDSREELLPIGPPERRAGDASAR